TYNFLPPSPLERRGHAPADHRKDLSPFSFPGWAPPFRDRRPARSDWGRELTAPMELERSGRVTVARASGGAASGGAASALRDFERLGELLRLDAVGVATEGDAETRILWWRAPGPPLPERGAAPL